ncbi:hypothetical protein AGRA3207_007460 [Actinomadura graeca]|uniref:Uncharacterized protein n=1 Tax=Actinomadura graeca TaxID=2750812 RepID=A0ABX8R4X9_9ACTN|nr:hypothetical protein [Actinomadura graeca]QXJ25893.1 hypothetical protein AGRA3207_007460 [Actinomadura graeca]
MTSAVTRRPARRAAPVAAGAAPPGAGARHGRGPGGYVVIGVHGGAGASTLARLLDPAGAGECTQWRPGAGADLGRTALLVARSTAAGLAAAAEWVTRWRPELRRPVLMVVADAPFRAPPLVRYRIRALSSRVHAVIEVPYFPCLRHLDDPAEALAQRKVAAAVGQVRRRLDQMPAPSHGAGCR